MKESGKTNAIKKIVINNNRTWRMIDVNIKTNIKGTGPFNGVPSIVKWSWIYFPVKTSLQKLGGNSYVHKIGWIIGKIQAITAEEVNAAQDALIWSVIQGRKCGWLFIQYDKWTKNWVNVAFHIDQIRLDDNLEAA